MPVHHMAASTLQPGGHLSGRPRRLLAILALPDRERGWAANPAPANGAQVRGASVLSPPSLGLWVSRDRWEGSLMNAAWSSQTSEHIWKLLVLHTNHSVVFPSSPADSHCGGSL